MSAETLRQDLSAIFDDLAKDRYTATDRDRYFALSSGSRPV